MTFLPDTNVWICLLKNPGGHLEAKAWDQMTSRLQPSPSPTD